MREGLLLALDGSTGVCSAALLVMRRPRHMPKIEESASPVQGADDDDSSFEVLARRSEGDGRAQAKMLLRLVDEMLEEAGRRSGELGAVVVGNGPGTFTGVRVTVATARALGLALAIPVVGVSTLGALAAATVDSAKRGPSTMGPGAAPFPVLEGCDAIVPVVDARRGQLFYAVYRRAELGASTLRVPWARENPSGVCDREALADVMAGGRNLIVGEKGLQLSVLPSASVFLSLDVGAEFLVIGQERLLEPGRLPEGERLGGWLRAVLGADGTASAEAPSDEGPGGPGTPESVKPIYIRSPDADVHITRMKDPWADG